MESSKEKLQRMADSKIDIQVFQGLIGWGLQYYSIFFSRLTEIKGYLRQLNGSYEILCSHLFGLSCHWC